MKTMFRISSASILVLGILFFSCRKEDSHGNDNSLHDLSKPFPVSVFLTDHQTPLLDSIFIDIRQLEIKLEDDSLPGDGWVSLDIHPGIYNILRLRNGLDTLFGTGVLPNGRLRKVRLTLGDQNSVMVDGQRFPLPVHDSRNRIEADLDDSNVELTTTGQLLFWIDFDAAKSIRVDNSGHGNNNGFELEPQIHIFTRHKSGSLEGRVLPAEAEAIVMAIQGTDTIMAIPEDDRGEFKILGLKEGHYNIFIDGNNGYQDTTINNVAISRGEDTHLDLVTLHP